MRLWLWLWLWGCLWFWPVLLAIRLHDPLIDFLCAEVGGHRLVKQDAFDEGERHEAVCRIDFGVTRLNQRVDHIVSRDVRGLGIGQQAEPERVVQERVQSLMHQQEGGEANRIACLVELGKAVRIE